MKDNKPIIILFFLLIILFLYLFFSTYNIIQQETIPITFKVAPYVGISVDKDKLHFGTVPQGGVAKRMFFLLNDDANDKHVSLKIDGSIKSWLSLSENRFRLSPNENKTIFVTLSVPEDAKPGNYTAELDLVFKKV